MMSKLKDAMIEVDSALDALKKEVLSKETLILSQDEISVYKMLDKKYADIISVINYIGKHQDELCKANRKTSL